MAQKTSSRVCWPGATTSRYVTELDFMHIHQFGDEGGRVHPPVLTVYSTVNRANILDFHPKLSVVNQFVRAGLSMFMIDWKSPSRTDLGLEEYAVDALGEAIDVVRSRTGAERVHLFGYCWGGLFALIYAALNPVGLASLTLLATPVDLGTDSPSTVELWARNLNAEPDRLATAGGFVPGEVIRKILTWANPVQLTVAKWYELLDCSHDPKLVRAFFEGQRWAYDSPPIARKLFGEVTRNIYQRNELALGKLRVGRRDVRLGAIRCPLISVVGDHDSSVSPKGSLRIGELVSTDSGRVHEFRVPTGHLGLCASIKSHTETWPRVTRLLATL